VRGLRERVDDLDAFDSLTRLQILGDQPIAAGAAGGVDDERVPEAETVESMQLDAFDDVVGVDCEGDQRGPAGGKRRPFVTPS
jgi:hypothetical protein